MSVSARANSGAAAASASTAMSDLYVSQMSLLRQQWLYSTDFRTSWAMGTATVPVNGKERFRKFQRSSNAQEAKPSILKTEGGWSSSNGRFVLPSTKAANVARLDQAQLMAVQVSLKFPYWASFICGAQNSCLPLPTDCLMKIKWGKIPWNVQAFKN